MEIGVRLVGGGGGGTGTSERTSTDKDIARLALGMFYIFLTWVYKGRCV